jgi:hypothetical protein
VELPYTLPQDFLLFVLMQEKNIDIWKKKLDWIADQGGMALFIAHPGYMQYLDLVDSLTKKILPRKLTYPVHRG